jgi:hypothetical protein
MKKITLTLSLLFITVIAITAQVRITEVDPMNNTVKIKNFGMMAVNVGNYVLCDNQGNYPGVTGVGAPTMIMASQEVELSLMGSSISLEIMNGNVALYRNSSNFNMIANMNDFFQWGAASGGRENIAVMKGIWMMGAFVMNPGPFTFTGNGMEMGNRMPFWQNANGGGGGGMMMMAIPHSDQFLFASRLSGSNQVPSVSTDASAVASYLLNANRDSICIHLDINNISSEITGVMINEGAVGETGPLAFDLTSSLEGNSVFAGITNENLTGEVIMKFLKGMYYINVKTVDNPDGEIRAQVKLETDMMFKGMLSDESHIHSVDVGDNDPWGLLSYGLSMDKKTLNYMVVAEDLTAPIQLATIMYGREGVAQNMVYNITNDIVMGFSIAMGSIDLTMNPAFVDSLMMGAVYVNLTTMNNPAGEVRGQLYLDNSISLDMMLDTAQVMGSTVVGSDAMGLGLAFLNKSLDTLKYDVIVTAMSGEITKVELLDGTDMDNMVMIRDLTEDADGNRIQGMIAGNELTDDLINLVLRGDGCFRVSTELNPMGELAGHIIKFARDGFTFQMMGDLVITESGSMAMGSGLVSLDRNWTNAHYMFSASGLESGFLSANFHMGGVGENGMMIKDVSENVNANSDNLFGGGFWKNTDMMSPFMTMDAMLFWADSAYIQINTMTNPGGEIRGQSSMGLACSVEIATGIDEIIAAVEESSIYPNPTNGEATLKVSLSENAAVTFQVYNSLGSLIINRNDYGNIGENQYIINLAGQTPGIYFIKIIIDNQVFQTKLMLTQ